MTTSRNNSEIEIIEHAFHNAFLNSYYIITGRKTIEDICKESPKKNMYFLEDPAAMEITIELLEELIVHFEHLEEYEKCQELLVIKNDIKIDSIENIKILKRRK